MDNLQLLALSGSLRATSFNKIALHALVKIAPENVAIEIGNLADIPLYNPDRESEGIESVSVLKSVLKQSDGLIIASPEYAHGISGVMKNALDWLVSGDEFVDKPIMLVNTSPRASHAQASLKEVLTTMSGQLVEKAHITIPLLGSQLELNGVLAHSDISQKLALGLVEFCEAIYLSKQETL